jgi:Tfp pilus assembly protein PilN
MVQLNINLLVRKDANKKRIFSWGIGFMIIAIGGSLTGFSYTSLSNELNRQKMINAELKSQINRYNDEIVALTPIRDMERELTRKGQALAEIEKERVFTIDIINEIVEIKPSGVLLEGVDIKDPKIVVNGTSSDHSKVARFIEGLENSSGFINVTQLTSKLNEDMDGAEFILEMEFVARGK